MDAQPLSTAHLVAIAGAVLTVLVGVIGYALRITVERFFLGWRDGQDARWKANDERLELLRDRLAETDKSLAVGREQFAQLRDAIARLERERRP